MKDKNREVEKPDWYYSGHWRKPYFAMNHFSLGIYIGRIKEKGNDIVFNIYTPFFSCGYAW